MDRLSLLFLFIFIDSLHVSMMLLSLSLRVFFILTYENDIGKMGSHICTVMILMLSGLWIIAHLVFIMQWVLILKLGLTHL